MNRATAALLLLLAGCASTSAPPSVSPDPYSFANVPPSPRNSDRVFVVLTFSGGGTRAAALAHGVLEELRHTPIGGGRTLLDEVDVISSVSGGSVTAAHYVLFREQHFETFERKFLHRAVTGDLIRAALRPDRLLRLASGEYSRADVAAEYFDSVIFGSATFRDLRAKGRPFLILNATDLSQGAPFEFTQNQFDLLCTDLSPFSVGRAVVASAAFPFLLTPIQLRNHADVCDVDDRAIQLAQEDRRRNPGRFAKANVLRSYRDVKQRPFIYLVDGGVADNLGVHTIVDALNQDLSAFDLPAVNLGKLDKLVVIVVDAKTARPAAIDQRERTPGVFSIVPASVSAPMAALSAQVMDNVRMKMNDLRARGVDTYLIRVAFDELESDKEVRFFNSISTNFGLPVETVDKVIDAGRRILRNDKEFQRLIGAIR